MKRDISDADEQNLDLVNAALSVDRINAAFYKKFPYPWPPVKFESLQDPYFETVMLGQTIGDWHTPALPRHPRIWVAGCGTNLAVYTALKFPRAKIIGSDLSTTSLEVCAETARQLEIGNLELREESINTAPYLEEFDFVVCTGVIHHNANPRATLDKLTQALKPSGVLELMVYNRYHFIVPAALQRAIRMLAGGVGPAPEMDLEISIARKLCESFPADNLVGGYLSRLKGCHDSKLADLITQPVLYSYTVESLEELAASCGLELLMPFIDAMDKAQGRFTWNMEFDDADLRARYEAMPDTCRWQISNMLLLEKSPILWFYLQRKDGPRARKSELRLCEEFLDTRFTRAGATQIFYIRGADGKYRRSPDTTPYPFAASAPSLREIVNIAGPSHTMRDIFARLGLRTDFSFVNEARIKLTTSAYPYLKAVEPARSESPTEKEARAEASRRRLGQIKPKPLPGESDGDDGP
jgi:SAM-dependent methyltransferase